jgi:hypothetical protein
LDLLVETGHDIQSIVPTINWIVGIYIDRAEERGVPVESLRRHIINVMMEAHRGGDNIAREFYRSFLIQS